MGMTMVIALGGTDLSVGALVAVSGALALKLMRWDPTNPLYQTPGDYSVYPFILVLVVPLLVCLLMGAFNGVLVGQLKLQPIIATLILMVSGRGIAQIITNGKQYTTMYSPFRVIGQGSCLFLPTPIVITVVVVAVMVFVRKTAFGTFVESVGINPSASMLSGINSKVVILIVFALTGNFLARGICSLISRESISINHPMIDALAGFKITLYHLVDGEWVKIKPVTSINLTVIIFIVMIVLGTIVLQHTRFGRNVYAIGGSESSARLMGLPVGKTKVAVYAINGFCSALAGIAYVLVVKSGWNMALQGGELEVISSAVIGGTLLTGGVGYMIGTMFGVLLKSVIPAIINFNGTLSSWWGKIATGALLLLFIVIQRLVVSYTSKNKAK